MRDLFFSPETAALLLNERVYFVWYEPFNNKFFAISNCIGYVIFLLHLWKSQDTFDLGSKTRSREIILFI